MRGENELLWGSRHWAGQALQNKCLGVSKGSGKEGRRDRPYDLGYVLYPMTLPLRISAQPKSFCIAEPSKATEEKELGSPGHPLCFVPKAGARWAPSMLPAS
jgi:hypothetical protein